MTAAEIKAAAVVQNLQLQKTQTANIQTLQDQRTLLIQRAREPDALPPDFLNAEVDALNNAIAAARALLDEAIAAEILLTQ
jgi:hypothetical protein